MYSFIHPTLTTLSAQSTCADTERCRAQGQDCHRLALALRWQPSGGGEAESLSAGFGVFDDKPPSAAEPGGCLLLFRVTGPGSVAQSE